MKILGQFQFPGTNKNLKILTGHTDKVTAVKWVKIQEGVAEKEIVSVSIDKTARVWHVNDSSYVILTGHEDGVNKVDCLYKNADSGALLVATGSVDSTIRLWNRERFGDEFSCSQVINLNRGLCVSIKLLFLPGTKNVLMACGRDTSKVEVYTHDIGTENDDFRLSTTLIGHENWIPGIDLAETGKNCSCCIIGAIYYIPSKIQVY